MAVVGIFGTAASFGSGSGTSHTVNISTDSTKPDRAIVVNLTLRPVSSDPTGVTATFDYGGSNLSMTLISSYTPSSSVRIYSFGLIDPPGDLTNAVVNFSWTNSCYCGASAYSLYDVDIRSFAYAFSTVVNKQGTLSAEKKGETSAITNYELGDLAICTWVCTVGAWGAAIDNTTLVDEGSEGLSYFGFGYDNVSSSNPILGLLNAVGNQNFYYQSFLVNQSTFVHILASDLTVSSPVFDIPLYPGDLRGTLSNYGGSQVNPSTITGSVNVSVGDLIYAVFGQQTNLTVGTGSTNPSDNLGNTYTWCNAGSDPGTPTARAAYSIVSVAGTLTSISVPATASTNDYANLAAVIVGPIGTIDANPVNSTNDITSPFTCPATGTLAQAREVVVAFYSAASSATFSATSPNRLAGQANNSTNVKVVIGHQAVWSTGSVSPAFTGTNPTGQSILGTTSFTISSSVSVTASNLTVSSPVLGTPTLTQNHSFSATAIADSSPSIGSPTAVLVLSPVATGISVNSPAIGVPSLYEVVSLFPTSFSVGSPVIDIDPLIQNSIFHALDFIIQSPVVGGEVVEHQIHYLNASTLGVSSPVIGAPALVFIKSLTATSLDVSSPVIGVAVFAQNQIFAPIGITLNRPSFSTISVGQNHIFTVVTLAASSPVLGTPVAHQGYGINAVNLVIGSPVIGSLGIGQKHNLLAVDKEVHNPSVGIALFCELYLFYATNIGVVGTLDIGVGHLSIMRFPVGEGFGIEGIDFSTSVELREIFNPRVKFTRADSVWTAEELEGWAEGYDDEGNYVRPLDHVGEKRKEAIFTNYNDNMYVLTAARTLIANDEDEHGLARSIHLDTPLYFADRKLKIDLSDKASVSDLLNEITNRITALMETNAALAATNNNLAALQSNYDNLKTNYDNLARAVSLGRGAISLVAGSPVISSPSFGQHHNLHVGSLVISSPSVGSP